MIFRPSISWFWVIGLLDHGPKGNCLFLTLELLSPPFSTALQGYNKDSAYEELGLDQELVMQRRRSYDVRPPTMEDDHPYWHGTDRR